MGFNSGFKGLRKSVHEPRSYCQMQCDLIWVGTAIDEIWQAAASFCISTEESCTFWRNTVEVLAKTDKLRQTVTNRAGFIRLSFVIYSRVPGPCRWSLPCLGSLFYQSVSYIRLSAAKKLQFTSSFS